MWYLNRSIQFGVDSPMRSKLGQGGLDSRPRNTEVHEYPDGHLAVFDGPRCLARYHADGSPIETTKQQAA